MNMQYAIEDGKVYVLEANPRASRTVPLVSKVCNIRMVPLATDIVTSELTGKAISGAGDSGIRKFHITASRKPHSPSTCSRRSIPVLGPEMRSTGEVLGSVPILRGGLL